MSTIANIVAFDGAATPVSHTFTPVDVTREKGEVLAQYREMLSTVPVYAQPSVVLRKKQMNSGVYRVSVRTEVPVMESVGSQNAAGYTAPPKVAYVDSHETVGYFHMRSTQDSRRLSRWLHHNICGNVSTTNAAATSGPVAELFDQLVMPN